MAKTELMVVVPATTHTSNVNIGTKDNPIFMDRPSRFWIPRNAKVKLKEDLKFSIDGQERTLVKKGEMTEIRHIRFCSSPYVVIQNLLGEEPTDDDYIRVEGGWQTFRREGVHVGLYDYLKICPYNSGNKLAGFQPVFKELDTEKEAIEYIESESLKRQAQDVIWNLYNAKTKSYDEKGINYYATILKINGASIAEKFVGLKNFAEKEPARMVHVIDNKRGELLEIITRAANQGLVIFSGNTVDNAITKLPMISAEKRMSRAIGEEKLMNFFATDEGQNDFAMLKKAVEELEAVPA